MTINIEQGEYTRTRFKSGRYKRRTLRNAWRRITSLQDRIIYRLEGCNPYCQANGGRLALWNHVDTTASACTLPMHIYNLSVVANTVNTSPNVAWVPQMLGPPDSMTLVALQNSAYSTGSTTWSDPAGGFLALPTWWIEKAPGPSGLAATQPYFTHSTLKWIDIKLMLYGTKNLPTMYDVMLCYVPDKLYNFQWHIDYTSSANPEWVNFIQENCEQFSFNPIHTADASMKSKIKPIWHKQFVIQTPVTNEGDASIPHFREVRIFKKLDKLQRYTWKDTGITPKSALPQGAGNATSYNCAYNEQVGVDYIKNIPDYSKNLFLIVRAISGRNSNAGPPATFNTANTPTYDAVIRVCHELPGRGYMIQ